jgi:hypothetical protein
MRRATTCSSFLAGAWLAACAPGVLAGEWPADLNPVTFHTPQDHPPLVLVEQGAPKATIAVMGPRSAAREQAVARLQGFLARSTGATLPIEYGQITSPAIVIGDCDLAAAAGLVGHEMPVEGFAIKSVPGHVFIVGRDEDVETGVAKSDGTAWGVLEFVERFVGVRWYFPGELGQSVPRAASLSIAPVWLEDAPAFRKREIWPPMSNP